MVVLRSNGGTPPDRLPSLSVESNSTGHSATSLRGSHHNKVPEIANQPLNTLLPTLPDGEQHPEPYYITQNVVLKAPASWPPWLSGSYAAAPSEPQKSSLLHHWEENSHFQKAYIHEFIHDAMYLELNGVCSATLAESTAKDKDEAIAMSYLEDHVITDVAYLECEKMAWEELWDQARKLSKEELDELHEEYGKESVDAEMIKTLRSNYTKPMTPEKGQQLIHHEWGELLYHLNKLMQRGSLMENYAIKKLQETIITQVAAKVLLDEALKLMEDEFELLDEEERAERPPREQPGSK